MQIDGRIVAVIGVVPAAVGATFSAFLWLDNRHAHSPDIVESEARAIRKVAMSDSTRYAELIHHYTQLQKERSLTAAEEARLDLARRMQMRIYEQLSE